jgi:hypothetical protein
MATGRKNPRTRGHQTRRARIRARIYARGHGRGQRIVPNGQTYTGKKISDPHLSTRKTRTDTWDIAEALYNLQF